VDVVWHEGPELFAEDDHDIGDHHGAIDDTWNTNPLFVFTVGIDGEEVERAKEEGIDPDGGFPLRGSGDDKRVECASPPVDQIDECVWWPGAACA
jgi:hypothetical protein